MGTKESADATQCNATGVKMRGTYTVCAASGSERRFKDALERRTGVAFIGGRRPAWLVNPLTGGRMELDMYCPERALAIEYDGPSHLAFPNGVHRSEAAFRAGRGRDALKEAVCARNGVTLLRFSAFSLSEETPDAEVARFIFGTCVAAARHKLSEVEAIHALVATAAPFQGRNF